MNNSKYTIISQMSMLQINLCVVVRNEHRLSITRTDSAKVAKGIGGIIGNKGAVAISFCLEKSSLCFILSHFAARPERLEQRNNNFHEISKELLIGKRKRDLLEQFDHVI